MGVIARAAVDPLPMAVSWRVDRVFDGGDETTVAGGFGGCCTGREVPGEPLCCGATCGFGGGVGCPGGGGGGVASLPMGGSCFGLRRGLAPFVLDDEAAMVSMAFATAKRCLFKRCDRDGNDDGGEGPGDAACGGCGSNAGVISTFTAVDDGLGVRKCSDSSFFFSS
jgi:hypothetical protein